MALTDYTDYPTVRSILGVGTKEIRDNVLALPRFAEELELDLDTVNPTLRTQYATIKAIEAADRTAAQAKLYNLIRLYASYSVAANCLQSVEMFAPKKITDGSASQERQDDAWANLRASVLLAYTRLRTSLLTALEVVDPTQPVLPRVRVRSSANVPLGLDPVTGA